MDKKKKSGNNDNFFSLYQFNDNFNNRSLKQHLNLFVIFFFYIEAFNIHEIFIIGTYLENINNLK